jgi:hypothetical protein
MRSTTPQRPKIRIPTPKPLVLIKKPMVLTYDADTGHTKIKNHCKKNGLRDVVRTSSGRLHKLPDTTLVGKFITKREAVRTFLALAKEAVPEAKIEKVLVVPYESLRVYNDEDD